MEKRGKTEIFGIKFDNLTMEEALEKIKGFVVLPYSEIIVRGQKDEEFKKILNSADFCLCEGRGLYLVARFIGKRLKGVINGIELIYRTCDKSQNPNSKFQTILLLGGTENVVEKTKGNLIKKFPNIKIVGAENGYQDLEKVIKKINGVKPDILLVAFGTPKQEKWIYNNLSKMPSVKLAMGVGGAFDFISGRIKRAPKFMQKIGLEWLWRLLLQPKRIKRVFISVGGLTWLTFKNMLSLK